MSSSLGISFALFFLSATAAFSAPVFATPSCTPAFADLSLGVAATGTVSCPQLNPSIGTLNYYLIYPAVGSPFQFSSASATFFNSNSTTFTSSTLPVDILRITYDLPGGPLVANIGLAASGSFVIPANGSITVPLNIFSGASDVFRSVMPLSLVTGTGSFSFGYRAEIIAANVIPGVSVTAATIGNYGVAPRGVAIQYEPVPEPSSAVLFGSALGVAALIRRCGR